MTKSSSSPVRTNSVLTSGNIRYFPLFLIAWSSKFKDLEILQLKALLKTVLFYTSEHTHFSNSYLYALGPLYLMSPFSDVFLFVFCLIPTLIGRRAQIRDERSVPHQRTRILSHFCKD